MSKLASLKGNSSPKIDFRYVFENSSEGLLVQNTDTYEVVDINEAALKILGLKRELVVGNNPSLYLPKYQPNGQRSIDLVKQTTEETKLRGFSTADRIHYKPDGTACNIKVKTTIIPNSNNELMMVSYTDNNVFKEQEDLIKAQYEHIKEKNDELTKFRRSNHDLEQYAYVASHDLKSPIRSIVGFSNILKEVLKSEDIESAKLYAGYIDQASKDMHDTIMGLFNYSKANSSPINIDYFSPIQLINNIILGQDHAIKEADAKIVIDGMPDNIAADRLQIYQLIQNLVSNSLKFRKKDIPLIVEILQEDILDEWIFEVRDNGGGFNPVYKDKVFEIFARLHSKEEHEGAGLGLALCKKIVEKHKGQIRVASVIGEGTTFSIELPRLSSQKKSDKKTDLSLKKVEVSDKLSDKLSDKKKTKTEAELIEINGK